MSLLSLDRSQNDSRLTIFLTKGKRVFHVSILSLVRSGNGFVYGRLSYGQTSTYHPRSTYYVTVLVFVCPYICTTLAYSTRQKFFPVYSVVPGISLLYTFSGKTVTFPYLGSGGYWCCKSHSSFPLYGIVDQVGCLFHHLS